MVIEQEETNTGLVAIAAEEGVKSTVRRATREGLEAIRDVASGAVDGMVAKEKEENKSLGVDT